MNPAVVLPKNKTKAFAAQGIVGSSVCEGTREGGGLPKGKAAAQNSVLPGHSSAPGWCKGCV